MIETTGDLRLVRLTHKDTCHDVQYRIPRRIIQTGKYDQSLRSRAVMSNVKLLNPDYEYLFFTDAQVKEFIEREFPDYRSVFESFRFAIQRYDFFRYLAVYRYGGFYLDLDVLLASGLSGLLQHGCVFSFEMLNVNAFMRSQLGMDWQVGNYAFGAAPRHPFIEAIIKNCVRGQKNPDWIKPMMRPSPPLMKDEYFVVNSTGPGLVSRTLAENPEMAQMVTMLFPDDVCDRRNWWHFGNYGIHIMDGSWRPSKSRIRRKLANYALGWMQRRCVKESLKLGKSRTHPGNQLEAVESTHDSASLESPRRGQAQGDDCRR